MNKEYNSITECSLCNIFNEKNTSLINTMVLDRDNFALVPSIGPLDRGHFLIVSKTHDCGLATMSKEKITEFFKLTEFILSQSKIKDVLFFEHGSYDSEGAGSCISHTHVHVLPDYAQYYSVLDDTLEVVYRDFSIEAFANIDFPYIMTFNSNHESRIYRAYNVPSQMMRMAICSKKELLNWDWKANQNIALIKSGIDFWTTAFQPNAE